ncbi:hypothetical protein CXF85_17100 [Colwellia sp. 75C3]|uniref:hypothetical protein n=1 Tax=Colwellia sp. 75C3 TaxID=888425 RepID=UPI000C32E5A9|nr:hypothetical protein [Colwellia sp. 75C3]PKG81691.1 hypothetical protein CXF85_17100 [Colwellia sp. 75C3]
MLSSKILVIYRIITVLLLSIPMAVNIYIKGDFVSSIVYVPLITLVFSGLAIFIDGKLEGLLKRGMVLPRFTLPRGNIHIKTANDIMV